MTRRPELGEKWVHKDRYANGDPILGVVMDIITHENGDPTQVVLHLIGSSVYIPQDRKLTTTLEGFESFYQPMDPPKDKPEGPTEWDRLSNT